MVILDTDMMTLLQWPQGSAGALIRARLQSMPSHEIATTIICFEEQMRGWLDAIRQSKEVKDQIEKYRYLKQAFTQYGPITLLDFDEVAATSFQTLRKQYRRIGVMDLKIAAIVLAHGAILWTRNLRDFGQIEGLHALDITKQ